MGGSVRLRHCIRTCEPQTLYKQLISLFVGSEGDSVPYDNAADDANDLYSRAVMLTQFLCDPRSTDRNEAIDSACSKLQQAQTMYGPDTDSNGIPNPMQYDFHDEDNAKITFLLAPHKPRDPYQLRQPTARPRQQVATDRRSKRYKTSAYDCIALYCSQPGIESRHECILNNCHRSEQ